MQKNIGKLFIAKKRQNTNNVIFLFEYSENEEYRTLKVLKEKEIILVVNYAKIVYPHSCFTKKYFENKKNYDDYHEEECCYAVLYKNKLCVLGSNTVSKKDFKNAFEELI